MPRDIVYFDLETQRTANDAGGWTRKGDMRMSVGVIFSTATGRYEVFGEYQVNQLIERLRRADLVVGFNILNFDYHVLMGYTILDLISELQTVDLMADMEKRLGHRLALDAIAHATLGIQKTAAGLDAIRWWREGRIMEIAEYCKLPRAQRRSCRSFRAQPLCIVRAKRSPPARPPRHDSEPTRLLESAPSGPDRPASRRPSGSWFRSRSPGRESDWPALPGHR